MGPLLLLLASGAAHALDGEAISQGLARFNAHAVWPLPTLSGPQLRELLGGDVLRWVDKPLGEAGPRRAAALFLSDQPKERVWLALQDPHFQADPAVHELRLTLRPPDDADWYGLLDLPAPFKDRQWVVRSWNNHALHAATGGSHWEHPWRSFSGDVGDSLAAARQRAAAGEFGSVTPEQIDGAITSPANHGAFLAIELPESQTLFGYHAAFDAGGHIPDWAVVQFAYAGLDRAMRRYARRAQEDIPAHYGPAHAPVMGGDGAAVSPQHRRPGID